MKTIAQVLLATAAAVLIAGSLHAEEQAQRFIVVLKQRSGAVPDVASLGGRVELQQDDQLVVTIPLSALADLKADPKVRYVEQVGGTPSDDASPLIGVPPDPRPGPASQRARFAPHALGSMAWDSGTYGYDGAGNIVSIGTYNYLYDGVQRLRQSSTQGTLETYTYDGFGNMQTRTNTIIPAVQPTTNRYVGYVYNEVGAVTSDGSYGFSYDAFGQPLSKIYNNDSSKLEYYIYTPGDERIGVQRAGWWTWSVRDEGGKVLRQFKSSSTNPSAPALWLEDFVWRDGLLLGSQRPVEMGGRRHIHLDHLGTPRLITADNGQMVSYHDYYPFGDEHSPVSQETAGGFDREDPMKFTGHERDYAGGMGGEDGHAIDDMHARYYSPTLARFLSPDPELIYETALTEPQGWNRYGYVRNNPLRYTDPTGKVVVVDDIIVATAVASVVLIGEAYLQSPNAIVPGQTNAQVMSGEIATAGQVMSGEIATAMDGLRVGLIALAEHVKGARPSTEQKHQNGNARRAKDRGGEKADDGRRPPRKRPPNWKGPWPPKVVPIPPEPKKEPPPPPKPLPTPPPQKGNDF